MKRIILFIIFIVSFFCGCSAKEVTFGVIADIHLEENHVFDSLVSKLSEEDLDFIVVLGDMCTDARLRNSTDNVDDQTEIYDSLSTLSSLSIPVYVIPGNHEETLPYYHALRDLYAQNSSIIDLSPLGYFEFFGFGFAALGGYHDVRYAPGYDFIYGKNKLATLSDMLHGKKDIVLFTHGPPLTEGSDGIDYVPGIGNVSDRQLNTFMEENNIAFSISGHIHESGQDAVDNKNDIVPEDTWSESMLLNAGAAIDGKASIVTLREGKMKYRSVLVR
ncbi:hypothetical protein COV93_07845 [Candidatus Woesearchaeota archaeon CG11_big_fil_rev_8_21_14_0_20_43_8]|nr:MAG: hypothetical protein COV93_07845 [Candidatus Woesearchaeota archaeon CG11_big_fil_rev_8_21_14_0_20_43_8]PIO04708.1 MAG: hypothetical protein COT47_07835 [Candidatus Woesearchaeota archaeon CG08_land_8_20_14_0_20_43_7]